MRRTLAVSTLMLALAAPAQSADKESWDFYKSADEAQFGYGVPESDLITITFRCTFKKKPIELVTTVLPAKPRKGQTLKTTLTNGAVTATYDGKTGHHSDHGYHFVADIPADADYQCAGRQAGPRAAERRRQAAGAIRERVPEQTVTTPAGLPCVAGIVDTQL
jgi:opacity protein-like surface antigen